MSEDPGFRVVDRRGSSSEEKKTPEPVKEPKKEGAGFVMSESEAPKGDPGMQVDFSTLVLSFATGAMIHLGQAPDPATGKVESNRELARQNIDILDILRTKTKGNLTDDENKLLESLLAELRLVFVSGHGPKK